MEGGGAGEWEGAEEEKTLNFGCTTDIHRSEKKIQPIDSGGAAAGDLLPAREKNKSVFQSERVGEAAVQAYICWLPHGDTQHVAPTLTAVARGFTWLRQQCLLYS